MYEDLERIVESRARSLDLLSSNYYNFLYSFHMKKGNLRKAATMMYEQGVRLGQETTGDSESLHQQAKCYLACLNALRLVDPRYAWIVKPVPHAEVWYIFLSYRSKFSNVIHNIIVYLIGTK